MASRGIKDRVAIVGMGCTKFGEHWDKGAEDLLVEAAYDAYAASTGAPPLKIFISSVQDDSTSFWFTWTAFSPSGCGSGTFVAPN